MAPRPVSQDSIRGAIMVAIQMVKGVGAMAAETSTIANINVLVITKTCPSSTCHARR